MHCKACNKLLTEKEIIIDDELCNKCLSISNKLVNEIDIDYNSYIAQEDDEDLD